MVEVGNGARRIPSQDIRTRQNSVLKTLRSMKHKLPVKLFRARDWGVPLHWSN